jgi:hypothetical protein
LTLGGSEHQRDNNVSGRRDQRKRKKKQATLCSDNGAGGREWHSREIKLKKSKHEGHIALGVK